MFPRTVFYQPLLESAVSLLYANDQVPVPSALYVVIYGRPPSMSCQCDIYYGQTDCSDFSYRDSHFFLYRQEERMSRVAVEERMIYCSVATCNYA